MRTKQEIVEFDRELYLRRWYDRHQALVASGYFEDDSIALEIREGAIKAAKEVEEEYSDLVVTHNGMDDQWAWAYICGKHAAIKWVLGEEHDNGDT